MPKRSIGDLYSVPPELILGRRANARVPEADQRRQRAEVEEILDRLRTRPGVILADEVGMGKTFVALSIACAIGLRSPRGPVIVMAPANLIDKWEQDLKTFCELYLEDRRPTSRETPDRRDLKDPKAVRYGIARHSIDLMKLLDDPANERCHLIFLAQGAMGRRQTDKWVRLALIAETLRVHATGRASRLIDVKKVIHRYLGQLLWAIGEERAHDWGEELWERLLRTPPDTWKDIYNQAVREDRQLRDDPVPKSVSRALQRIRLKEFARALEQMPIRASGPERTSERVDAARDALREIERELWKDLLAEARWRSPLLVMDEAHHLKNPGALLARQLQSPELDQDLRTGDGAMSNAFDRMLFLTATPFQLGHRELVRVLERFGDVRWDEEELGDAAKFHKELADLGTHLDESQRAGIALQRAWARLRPEDFGGGERSEDWWDGLRQAPRESLSNQQRAVVEAFDAAREHRIRAEEALRPWIVRHNKGERWVNTEIARRRRLDGAAMIGMEQAVGLPIPAGQLLPFFLAARSAIRPGQDLLGEALCSSYEAFRLTRQNREVKDDQEEPEAATDLSHAGWYLEEFDRAIAATSGVTHPKMAATVRTVGDLWSAGEKVLVFAFYRHTCRALRIHISQEIERRVLATAQHRLQSAGAKRDPAEVESLLERAQRRYFDDLDSPGRREVDRALEGILAARTASLSAAGVDDGHRNVLTDVMRRFLRVRTTILRCFPLEALDSIEPALAVHRLLDHADGSGVSWHHKFDRFISFLVGCPPSEREEMLAAAAHLQTGGIRVADEEEAADPDSDGHTVTLANVQVATGETRRETRSRLMRAFNTPFFPDVLVCSEVMGEGVDLQRFCRHVIHHDLAWNPSSIEQRTGRIDRLGCAAEGRHPIVVYLPYLAGTADERQYRVMSEREQWFRVVMGQDQVAKLITPESTCLVPLPTTAASELTFNLALLGPSVPL